MSDVADDGRDDAVGYGKPPRHSRWKPGQSGNAKGRPKGARGKHSDLLLHLQPTRRIIMEELHKPVRIRENGKAKYVPAIQAIAKAAVRAAAEGGQMAQRTLMTYGHDVEAEIASKMLDAYSKASELKELGEDIRRSRIAAGLSDSDILPHPDDIHLDPETLTFEIRGPCTLEERASLDKVLALRDEQERGFHNMRAEMWAGTRDRLVPGLALMTQIKFDQINERLPKRYQKELTDRLSPDQVENITRKIRSWRTRRLTKQREVADEE